MIVGHEISYCAEAVKRGPKFLLELQWELCREFGGSVRADYLLTELESRRDMELRDVGFVMKRFCWVEE